jgi:hypothetical protein
VGEAYGMAAVLFVSQFLGTFFSVKSDFIAMRMGLKVRRRRHTAAAGARAGGGG